METNFDQKKSRFTFFYPPSPVCPSYQSICLSVTPLHHSIQHWSYMWQIFETYCMNEDNCIVRTENRLPWQQTEKAVSPKLLLIWISYCLHVWHFFHNPLSNNTFVHFLTLTLWPTLNCKWYCFHIWLFFSFGKHFPCRIITYNLPSDLTFHTLTPDGLMHFWWTFLGTCNKGY